MSTREWLEGRWNWCGLSIVLPVYYYYSQYVYNTPTNSPNLRRHKLHKIWLREVCFFSFSEASCPYFCPCTAPLFIDKNDVIFSTEPTNIQDDVVFLVDNTPLENQEDLKSDDHGVWRANKVASDFFRVYGWVDICICQWELLTLPFLMRCRIGWIKKRICLE